MTLSEIYLKAADVIRTNGHYKGAYWGRPESGVGIQLSASESPVCAAGALSVVVSGHPMPSVAEVDPVVVDFATRRFGAVNAEAALVAISSWNDQPERTAADVIEAFEQTAREVA